MNERPSTTGAHPEQEPGDLRPGAIVLCAAGVILMVLLAALLAHLLTRASSATRPAPASTYLTSDPDEEISRFEQDKRSKLETYGWVEEKRFAHIPIERAMRKLAAEKPSAGSPHVNNVGWDQHLGAHLPLQLRFRDESNHLVTLGDYFGRTPVVLVPTYFSCPELCPMVLQGVQESLRKTGLDAKRDYQLLAVSIDPRDTPAGALQKKGEILKLDPLRRSAHFLTASDASSAVLAHALGMRYTYDSEHGQFAHAAGFVIVNGHGELSRYVFGIRYPPETVRTALIEAGRGHIAAYADQLLLLCYHFDPTVGRYSFAIISVLRVIGVLAVLLGILGWWRLS